ncbi:LPD7 domain-containing protein [Kushneria indalinina]|uniref:LPD7 domain-containing protein n=1 Tax=Kushneria indalinina TaxID=184067 RepID=UPI0011C03328|nr:LPD7 domain-containing protein [Kushneria indalinina]
MKFVDIFNASKNQSAQSQEMKDATFYDQEGAIRASSEKDSIENLKTKLEKAHHNSQAIAKAKVGTFGEPYPTIHDLKLEKLTTGSDHYHNGEKIFSDHGDFVSAHSPSNEISSELSLDYATKKYGSNLEVSGSDSFKLNIIIAANKNNLKIEFSDPAMNENLQSRRDALKEHSSSSEADFTAIEAAKNLKTMPENFLGNDGAEGAYLGKLESMMDSFPNHEYSKIQKSQELVQNTIAESARHRGQNLLPATDNIARNNGGVNVYQTNVRKVMLAEERKLHDIGSNTNYSGFEYNPDQIKSNIEKGNQLLEDFSHQTFEAMREGSLDNRSAWQAGNQLKDIPGHLKESKTATFSYINGLETAREEAVGMKEAAQNFFDTPDNEPWEPEHIERDRSLDQHFIDGFQEDVSRADALLKQANERLDTISRSPRSLPTVETRHVDQGYGMD